MVALKSKKQLMPEVFRLPRRCDVLAKPEEECHSPVCYDLSRGIGDGVIAADKSVSRTSIQ